MDKIRQDILHEQEVRKSKLAAHFGQSFSPNGTVNEDGRDIETTATKSANEVHRETQRQSVIKAVEIDGVDNALDILKAAGEEDLFEKAKHQDGDMHPNGKWVWVASAAGGKGDWRTIGGRAHKKSGGGSTTSTAKPTQQSKTQPSNNAPSKTSTVTLDQLKNAVGNSSFMDDQSWIDVDGKTYVKIGKDKWQYQSSNSHVLSSPISTAELHNVIKNAKSVDTKGLIMPKTSNTTAAKTPISGKITDNINIDNGDGFSYIGISSKGIFKLLFPDLNDFTYEEMENAGYDTKQMSALAKDVKEVSKRVQDLMMTYQSVTDKLNPPESHSYGKLLYQHFNKTTFTAATKKTSDIEKKAKEVESKLKKAEALYDNTPKFGRPGYNRKYLEGKAYAVAKLRAEQLAYDTILEARKVAKKELGQINLSDYKVK